MIVSSRSCGQRRKSAECRCSRPESSESLPSQNVLDQRSRGGFAIRAGDADQLALQKPVRQFDFAPNGHALGARGLQQRRIRGHAGAGDDQILLQKCFLVMAAKFQRSHPRRASCERLRRSRLRCANQSRSRGAARRRKTAPWPLRCAPVPPPARVYLFRSIEPRVPASPVLLPQFQSRQRKQRKHQRHNPKAHDHFRFAPSQQLKVMMNGRHAENPLAAQFERTNLQNHGQALRSRKFRPRKRAGFPA